MEAGDNTLGFGPPRKANVPGATVFGRYRLERVLGQGGMGVVWLAHDLKLEEDIALKFLPDSIRSNSPGVEELKRETRKSRQLTHPNIVRIHDFIEGDGMAAISMEFIDGNSLADLRARLPNEAFEPEELRAWLLQICAALDYAHEDARIVHRDLKPANIMVASSGKSKITDFGISRSISDTFAALSAYQARPGSGSPPYMSPQQASGEPATPLDDIYGFGATLYDLLTGKPPFYTGDIYKQVETRTAPPVSERRKELGLQLGEIPREWEALIAACLAKAPAARPPSARAIAEKIQEIKALTPRQPPPSRPAQAPRARLALAARVLILSAALAVAGGLVLGALGIALSTAKKRPAAASNPLSPTQEKTGPSDPIIATEIEFKPVGGESGRYIAIRAAGGVAGTAAVIDAATRSVLPDLEFTFSAEPKIGSLHWRGDIEAMYVGGPVPASDWPAILALVRKAADAGSPSAEFALGKMHAMGWGVEKNPSAAARWYASAAEKGHPPAKNNLAMCYQNGDGVEADPKKAFALLSEAAARGVAVSETNLAFCFLNSVGTARDESLAADYFRRAAEKGFPRAQAMLGAMISDGIGFAQNDTVAAEWYKRSAEKGDPLGKFFLAGSFAGGRGVKQNPKETLRLYREAAGENLPAAQNALGELYADGKTVPRDDKEALRLFREAAEKGHVVARNNLAFFLREGRGTTKNFEESAKLYRLSAEGGNAHAQAMLGLAYFYGMGVQKDDSLAIKWFRLSADQGNPDGIVFLGLLHEMGRGVPQNSHEAVRLYRIAAEKGDPFAATQLRRHGIQAAITAPTPPARVKLPPAPTPGGTP